MRSRKKGHHGSSTGRDGSLFIITKEKWMKNGQVAELLW